MGTESKKARYMEAAELLGEILDVQPDEALQEYTRAVETSSYPGPDCLEPHEVEAYLKGEALTETSAGHVRECGMCSAVLEAARPTSKGLDEVLRAAHDRFTGEDVAAEEVMDQTKAMS